MKKILLVTIMSVVLVNCAKNAGQDVYNVAPSPSPSAALTEDQQIQQVVDAENTYREQLGQTELSSGLSCSVQQVASGQWLSSSSPGYQAAQGTLVLTGSSYTFLNTTGFDQPNSSSGLNNIIPVAIAPLFVGLNYRIVCSGQIAVLVTAYYSFDVNSDDGSILNIDGTNVIVNDGNHGMTDKVGTKLLRTGVHTFQLQYAQSGAGAFGLILQANGSLIDPKYYFH